MQTTSLILFVLTAAACAGSETRKGQDAVVGHWMGAIDGDGWQRMLSVDITTQGSGYGGSWMSLESQPGVRIDRVEVQGEAVRLDLKTLSFDGRIDGRRLTGAVFDKSSGQPSGQFVLTRIDPRPAVTP
jgi:hypothetical protein